MFAFDEFGPLGMWPTAGSCWAEGGRPEPLPAAYRRAHGVRYFHGRYSISDSKPWGVNRRKKGAANTLATLKSIPAARPDGAPIHVILDSLSAHKGEQIRRWAKNWADLSFTPTYASWANPIEARFGPLRQFAMLRSQHAHGAFGPPATEQRECFSRTAGHFYPPTALVPVLAKDPSGLVSAVWLDLAAFRDGGPPPPTTWPCC